MTQTAIPFLFMRGGTSRAPYFNRADLPQNRDQLSEVLIALIGSGHPLNIDGIGGGATVTTKVAMLSKSLDEWADIDYFFAQVSVEEQRVDYGPTCGNILSGVGPAALEMGLHNAEEGETTIKIRLVNTGARATAKVQTANGQITYHGNTAIDGVPGTAAPIELLFMDTVGRTTGTLLPTGNLIDTIDTIVVTCMDVAMPMVFARAEHVGVTGYEGCRELDKNRALLDRMEAIRIAAGKKMGLGDVSRSVIPKFGLLAPAVDGGAVCVRYFTPLKCHPSMAVTGAQCTAACLLTPDTVAHGLVNVVNKGPATITLEHPSGQLDVLMDYAIEPDGLKLRSSGLIRTARKLAEGKVFIPSYIWAGLS